MSKHGQIDGDKMNNDELVKLRLESKIAFQKTLMAYFEEGTARSEHVKNLPSGNQKLFYDVYNTNKGYAKAVKAKCLDCTCCQKNEITNCTVEICPLWNIRPYQV